MRVANEAAIDSEENRLDNRLIDLMIDLSSPLQQFEGKGLDRSLFQDGFEQPSFLKKTVCVRLLRS